MANKLFKQLTKIETLKKGWHLVRNDARDDFIQGAFDRYSEFAFDLDDNIEKIQQDIINERYYPKPLLNIDVPKSSLAVRPGSIPEIEDRIVTFSIIYLIAGKLDKRLPEGVYSCRLKKGKIIDNIFEDNEILKYPFLKKETIKKHIDIIEPWYKQWPKFIEEARYVYEQEGYNYLATSDIVSYFENISLEILRDEILLKYIPREQKIINLLMHILHYWTWKSFDGKPVLRGIPQGNEVSSFLGNIYLLPLDDKFSKIKEVRYFRYIDDVKIFSKNENISRKNIFLMNDILRSLHLNIQGNKTLIFKDKDILYEICDERFERVNNVVKDIGKGQNISNLKRLEYINILKKEYKNIKWKRKQMMGKDLRLFNRFITGFTLLKNPYLVNRILKEVVNNPDYKLMTKAQKYLKHFPRQNKIVNHLTRFLESPTIKFAIQESKMLDILMYMNKYPKNAILFANKLIRNVKKEWYVRVQAILFIEQFIMDIEKINPFIEIYRKEQNVEVKKAIIRIICQTEKNKFISFIKESAFDKDPRISEVLKMLSCNLENEQRAKKALQYIFNDFYEEKLMDNYYQIEVIKMTENKNILKYLYGKLKDKRAKIKRECLEYKVEKTIKYLEDSL